MKTIPNTDDYYLVSEDGRVYSLYEKGSHRRTNVPRELAQGLDSKGRYAIVGLITTNGRKTRLVHRLVAQAFVPNPLNLPEVHHKDGNPRNNHYSNLQWVSRAENLAAAQIDYGGMNGLRTKTRLFSPDGVLMGEFSSITEAAKFSVQFGCSRSGMARNKKSKGFYLVLDRPEERTVKARTNHSLLSPSGEFIGTFSSARKAALFLKNEIPDLSVSRFQINLGGRGYTLLPLQEGVETKGTFGDRHQGEAQSADDGEEIVH